jgi:hypothetical protein
MKYGLFFGFLCFLCFGCLLYLGSKEGHGALDDLTLCTLLAGTFMLFNRINSLDDHFALARENLEDLAGLALVVAREYEHNVVFLYMHGSYD